MKYSTNSPNELIFHIMFRGWFSFSPIKPQKDWAKEWFKDVEEEVELNWELEGNIP